MIKTVLVCGLSLLFLALVCDASSVSRTFSKTTALPSENIYVSLTVTVTLPQDTYYAIDENYPSGWTVISTNGDTNQSGHIKWVVIESAVSTVYNYTIRTAATPGNHTFSGFYEFNSTYSNPSSPSIAGQSQVTVAGADTVPPSISFYPPTPANSTAVQLNYIYVNVLLSETPGSCTLDWHNGSWQNLSMSVSGFSCYRNMTGLANGTYQFRVYAADAAGNLNVSAIRQNTVSYSPPEGPYCGDGDCLGSETCSSCSQDCGACPPSQPPSDGGSGGGGGGGGGGGVACINSQTRNCSLNYKGKCAIGTETCTDGSWTGCPIPSGELCNRMDDDCDGQTDESLICNCHIGETRECGSNVGECRNGTIYCFNGKWGDCANEVKPSFEECNGLDDDCDDETDENCTSTFPWCANGPVAGAGCRCGDKVYTSGYCYSGAYSETSQEKEIPWMIFFMIFTALIALAIGAVITLRARRGRGTAVTWKDLKENSNPAAFKFLWRQRQ